MKDLFALVDKPYPLQAELEARFGNLNGAASPEGHAPDGMDAATRELLRHYAHHHPEALIIETDTRGRITEVNENWLRATGFGRDEVIGELLLPFLQTVNEIGLLNDLEQTKADGKPWNNPIQIEIKSHQFFVVDMLVLPVRGAGGLVERFWSISYDITEQVRKVNEIKAKEKEVKESLTYAKRIQQTILPDKNAIDETVVKKMEAEWFVMYKPKDIVSGDFYWYSFVSPRTAFLAVVDCTGHGVPGAFMSLIGYNLLNQIVNVKKILKPGEILAELHREVRSTLKQDAEDSKSRDGMDVCLVALDLFDDTFEYAGANRPLFFFHNGELQEVKPDKASIGGEQMEEDRVFKTHTLEFASGDSIYMVSDGYVDQFGGPDQKKFSTKRFRELIVANQHDKMSVQKAMFNLAWKDWKGDDEQIDDVTLIGVKFS